MAIDEIPFPNDNGRELRIKFTEQDVKEELDDLLYTDKDKIHFHLHVRDNMVDVYYNKSLIYQINRSLYYELTRSKDDDSDNIQSKRDCAI